jgi:RNA polymerase sigma-70 factor (ECF subfamily)
LTNAEFEALYRALWQPMVNYLRFRVGAAEAADLAAETFVRGWVARTTYDPGRGTPSAWLWAIARHLASDRLRRSPGVTEPLAMSLADDHDVAADSAAADEVERVLAAVAQLSADDREVVSLRFGAGIPYRDIGAMLAVEPGTVAVRLHRAVARLRAALEDVS